MSQEQDVARAAEQMARLAQNPEMGKLLGLVGSVPDAAGAAVEVGSTIQITGRVLRIHGSGFMVVSVEGAEPQPAVLVRGGNVRRV